jgi:NADPH-ferrihemoprotein reductase
MYRSIQSVKHLARIRPVFRSAGRPNSFSTSPVHLRIIFGSQSGTAEAFANELEFDAQEANISAEVIDALNFTPEQLKKDNSKNIVNAFVVACYGEGEPTDNAKKFISGLEAGKNETLAGSKFAVFGLGNSQCFRDRFNVVGKRLDKKLEDLGGQRMVSLGLGDASPELTGSETMGERFITWKQNLLKAIQQMEGTAAATPSSSSTLASEGTPVVNEEKTQQPAPPTPTSLSETLIALSARQRAMIPAHRTILHSTVSHVTQLFTRTDEYTAAVEVEFDLNRTNPLFATNPAEGHKPDYNKTGQDIQFYYTAGLQPGDHIGVFAPNSRKVVERFALAAGLTSAELDALSPNNNNEEKEQNTTTLRQTLTWQFHLTGVASSTSIKLLQRWLKEQQSRLPLTTKLFSDLEAKYDSLVRDKGLDTPTILDMIPKLPGVTLPIPALLKTLPTLNPRLYSITHMVLPSERAAATAARAKNTCSITAALQKKNKSNIVRSPTAADDYTKITLLCRLLRYRVTKSSANRVVEGVCSSYLTERLTPEDSQVAIFFRESNFHLPNPVSVNNNNKEKPAPVIMIAGGSGLAPFMSFLEERERLLSKTDLKIGPAVLYFGCRTNEEYMFRDKLVSYLGDNYNGSNNQQQQQQNVLDRLVTSFSSHFEGQTPEDAMVEPCHPNEIINPREEHIPDVFKNDRQYFIDWIREGGHIYVCGGAGQFGKAVREAVNEIVMEAYQMKPSRDEQGKEIIHPGIRYLIQSKRYFEDLAD